MYKKIFIIIGVIFALALAAVFASTSKPVERVEVPKKILVTASFYPLAYVAEQVGGDKVAVRSITPNGTEPHDFEPTPQDIITLRSSRVFIYNGNGIDAWADRLQSELIGAGVKTVSASEAVSISGNDPHIWLDPVRMRAIAEFVRDTLAAADPANAEYYRSRGNDLSVRLTALHNEYEKTLFQCATRDVIVSHDAFGYPAERYRLIIHPIAGISPEEEPSAKRLAELSAFVKEKKVTTVFFETLVSPRLAETLAKETGAKTDVLNPIEGLTANDIAGSKNYESIMRDNLRALAAALICK